MSVRALRRGAIAASRAVAATPTTYTIFASTPTGWLFSENANGATALAGSGVGLAANQTNFLSGQEFGGSIHSVYESFIEFDTSGVAGTIQSVTLSLRGKSIVQNNAYTFEARLFDFGSSLTTADWVPGTNLASQTLLASLPSSSYDLAYMNFASEAALLTNVNQAGATRLVICTSRMTSGTVGGTNYFSYESPFGTNKPKLVIESLA